MNALRSRFGQLLAILVADSEGKVLATSSANLPESFSADTDALFARLRDSRRQTFSCAWIRNPQTPPCLTWGLPLEVDDRLVGFVKAIIDVRNARALLGTVPHDPFQVSLLDSSGAVVACSDPQHRPLEGYFYR